MRNKARNARRAVVAGAVAVIATLPLVVHAASSQPGTPETQITSPADRSRSSWTSTIGYAAAATYQGKSTSFDELPANAVVVEARIVPDVGAAATLPRALPAALSTISQSNCAGCHDFTSAGAGPSFAAVAARYAGQAAAPALLAAHIREGSRGTWGSATMPPHPEISPAAARAISDWILAHGADSTVRYFIGTQGSIRMTPPAQPGPAAGLILTAYYSGPLTADDSVRSAGPKSRIVVIGTARP